MDMKSTALPVVVLDHSSNSNIYPPAKSLPVSDAQTPSLLSQ